MRIDFKSTGDLKADAVRIPVFVVDERPDFWTNLASALLNRGFALFALAFFAPFIATISAVLFLAEGGPVFFRHRRIGKNGQTFDCLKFRTMAVDAEARLQAILESDPQARAQWEENQKLDDDPRITCIGEFFRKTSLDELPQFWNVLKGEMNVVGPRPIVSDEAHHYGNRLHHYLSVKPGVTGFWQVNGRSKTTYDERVQMDVDYVANRSFAGDIVIIVKTVKVMILGRGAQ